MATARELIRELRKPGPAYVIVPLTTEDEHLVEVVKASLVEQLERLPHYTEGFGFNRHGDALYINRYL